MVINPLPRCPHCEARMLPAPGEKSLWCQFCGTTRDDPDARQQLEAYLAADRESDYEPPTHDPEMDLTLRYALQGAWDCIHEGDPKTARFLLNNAVAQFPNNADLYYLLSLTTDDARQKLEYLERALAIQPYHEYAWRDKGVLEGVIPPTGGGAAEIPDPVEPVPADSDPQICPSCHAPLAFETAAGAVICPHCGFRPGQSWPGQSWPGQPPRPISTPGGYEKLDHALLRRRFGFSKEWHIGKRVLVCQNCHAQLTLSGATLSTSCPFCDTPHVLVQDAVGSFEEPDALIPFALDRQAAQLAAGRQLTPAAREQVERLDLLPVYLPFWDFAVENIVLTGLQPRRYAEQDVLVSGATQLAQVVLLELMPYHLDALVPYEHHYLAQMPAQIYSTDAIQASIAAWAHIKQAAHRPLLDPPDVVLVSTDLDATPPPGNALWGVTAPVAGNSLSYRLILLPVWMVTLYLRDRSHQPAVVNGQTGEAVISASFAHADTLAARPERPVRTRRPAGHITPLPGRKPRRRNVIRPLRD